MNKENIKPKNEADRGSFSFTSLKSSYRQLQVSDRAFINSVGLGVILLTGFAIGIGFVADGWKGVGLSLAAAIMGIIVGAVFSILDRIGVAAPIEDRLQALLQQTEDRNSTLARTISETIDYAKYDHARKRFGISDVKGELTADDGVVEIKRESDEFAISLFDKAKPGWLIRYMNTVLEEEARYYHAIRRAMERGVHVRILMMQPDLNSPAFINRYNDCMKTLFEDQSIEDISTNIRLKLSRLDTLRQRRDRLLLDNKSPGSFDIRYYDQSLNFPMLLLTESDDPERTPDVAYTGFYGLISSESMPYVEWRDGEFPTIEKFKGIFDRKWKQCKGSQLHGAQPL